MKTLKLIFVLLVVLLSLNTKSKAQNYEWAPVGATWYYTQLSWGEIIYEKIKCIEKVTIGGKICKKLHREVIYDKKKLWCDFLDWDIITYSDSGKIYYYDDKTQEFRLLYNFKAKPGEKWTIKYNRYDLALDSLAIKVDSINYTIINGNKLKIFYIQQYTYGGMYSFSLYRTIIENIGHVLYLLPQNATCDPFTGPLRCYEDSIIGLYETGKAPYCDYIFTDIKKHNKTEDILVFKNFNHIDIEILESGKYIKQIQLFDILGKLIFEIKIRKYKYSIDLSKYKPGIYFCKIQLNDLKEINYKLIN